VLAYDRIPLKENSTFQEIAIQRPDFRLKANCALIRKDIILLNRGEERFTVAAPLCD
jgi:hypothetical protein